jgi:hypothetical protein
VGTLFALVTFVPQRAEAASYYVATNGSDSNSCQTAQTATAAKRTVASLATCLSAGSVGIMRHGTYPDSVDPLPNGSASGGYVTLQAEHEGAVILTGGINLSHATSYQSFVGLRFHNQNKTILGNHLKFLRDEFMTGCASGNCTNTTVGTNDFNDTADILLEDVWLHGAGGRYNLLVYNSTRVVVRRAVIRHGGSWTDDKGDPEAGITFYNTRDSAAQNVMVLDSNLSYHTWQSAMYNVFNTVSPNGNDRNNWVGIIALNNLSGSDGAGLRFDGNGAQTGHVIQDAILWDANWGLNVSYASSVGVTGTRLTIGRNSGSSEGIGGTSGGTKSFSNVRLVGASVSDVTVTTTATGLPVYLPQQSGGVGANVQSRIGAAGSLAGEMGWNSNSGVALWPWPNEARILKEMCTDAGVTRGFCTDSSLTNYVWNYLGNGNPVTTTTAPAAPVNVRITP